MNASWASLFLSLAALGNVSCVMYERAADVRVYDPSRVALDMYDGRRVLAVGAERGHVPRFEMDVTRGKEGTIDVGDRTLVGRDGRVSGLDSLAETTTGSELRLPVCMRYHRGGCRPVEVVTPFDNVRTLKEYESPVRFFGFMELVVAGAMVGGGIFAASNQGHQTTTGGALLIGAGGLLGVVAMVQLLASDRDVHSIVDER